MVASGSVSRSNADRGGRGDCSGRGGRGNDRTPRQGTTSIDLDAKHYNNPFIKVCLVFPGNVDMTAAFSSHTIPTKHFVCGKDHSSTHESIMNAIYQIITRSISQVFDLDNAVKSSIHSIIEGCYNGKSIGNETFRFAARINPRSFFTFPAASKYVAGNKAKDKTILCICPPAISNMIWELCNAILRDNPLDEFY